jgi:membrane fusion protein, multidrug efflux system
MTRPSRSAIEMTTRPRVVFNADSAVKCAAVLMALVLFASCSPKSPRRAGGPVAVPVAVANAVAQDVPVELQAIGTVQAFSTVLVRPQITGPIMEVHFQEGEEVKTGDLLFSLDQRPWQAALNQAMANLKRDEAQLINARLQFERTSNLFESKIASQQDFDTAEATYRAAEGTVQADSAAITNAQVSLDYTTIRAPIEGRTGSPAVKKGNVVKAPDDVLVTITQIHPIYVAFAVPEQNLPVIRQRSSEAVLPVEAFTPGDSGPRPQGDLSFINNMVDTNTGMILLKATFANTNSVLWPGQFVQVSVTLSNLEHATVVPSQAVQAGQHGEYIFVVKPDATVEPRPVLAGITYEGLRVISGGLRPGEVVVTDGQLRLTNGASVSIKTPAATGAATNSVAKTAVKSSS